MATVMASVGAYLRELRTSRSVSLDEVARLTRVPPRYLTALESDAFSELPAPVFIRGFIRAYCQALGQSPGEALGIYDSHEGRPPQPVAPPAPLRARSGPGEPRSRGTLVVSFILLVVLGMALFTVALVLRPGERLERSVVEVQPAPLPAPPAAPAGSSEAVSDAPSSAPLGPPTSAPATPPAAVRPPAPAAPPTPAAGPPRPSGSSQQAVSPATTPPPDASATRLVTLNLERFVGTVSSPYRLIARTSESTWIRVRTDDGRSSDETVPAGEVREWVSDRPFVVTVGNAAGVSFELNGRALPPLGGRGVVIPRLVLPPESR